MGTLSGHTKRVPLMINQGRPRRPTTRALKTPNAVRQGATFLSLNLRLAADAQKERDPPLPSSSFFVAAVGSVIRGGSMIYPVPANSIRSDLSRNPVPRRRIRWRPSFITRRDPQVRPSDNAVNNYTTHGNIQIAVIICWEAGAIDHGDGSWRGGGVFKGAVPLRV